MSLFRRLAVIRAPLRLACRRMLSAANNTAPTDPLSATLKDFLARSDRVEGGRKGSLLRYEQQMYLEKKPLYNYKVQEDMEKGTLRSRRKESLFAEQELPVPIDGDKGEFPSSASSPRASSSIQKKASAASAAAAMMMAAAAPGMRS